MLNRIVDGSVRISYCLVYLLGNTRVIGQQQLQQFQEEMGKILHDPFQVVMRQTRAPISLLQEKAKVL